MTTPVLPTTFPRAAVRALVVAVALLALLVAASPAAAAKPCGRQVIDDWYDDGRVDGTYPEHCYDDAIESLPRDVRDYSSAKEDIERALQARLRGEPAPPATTDPSPGGGVSRPAPDSEKPAKTTTSTSKSKSTTTADEDDGAADTVAAPPLDGESASSVPIPLLILAGLALLLVAGGSAGYLVRRLQARRLPPVA